MSIEHRPGQYLSDPNEKKLFDWLENNLRNKQELLEIESRIKSENPVLYGIIANAASELAPGDPKSHATYFGSLLLLASEINLRPEKIRLAPATTSF